MQESKRKLEKEIETLEANVVSLRRRIETKDGSVRRLNSQVILGLTYFKLISCLMEA